MGPAPEARHPLVRALLLLALVLPATALTGCFLLDGVPGAETETSGSPGLAEVRGLGTARELSLDLAGVPRGVPAEDVLRARLAATLSVRGGDADLATAGYTVSYQNATGAPVSLDLASLAGPTLRAGALVPLPDASPFTGVTIARGGQTVYARAAVDGTGLGVSPGTGKAVYALENARNGSVTLANATIPGIPDGPRYERITETLAYRETGTYTLTYDAASPSRVDATLQLDSRPLDGSAFLLDLLASTEHGPVSSGFEVTDLRDAVTVETRLAVNPAGRLDAVEILGGEAVTDADVTTWHSATPEDGEAARNPCAGTRREDRCRFDSLYDDGNGGAVLPNRTAVAPARLDAPQGNDSLLPALLGKTLEVGDRVHLRLATPATATSDSRLATYDIRVTAVEEMMVAGAPRPVHRVQWTETSESGTRSIAIRLLTDTNLPASVEEESPGEGPSPIPEILERLSFAGADQALTGRTTARLTEVEGAPWHSPGVALLLATGMYGIPGLDAPFLSHDTLLQAATAYSGIPDAPAGRPEVVLAFTGRLGEAAVYEVVSAPAGLTYGELDASVNARLLRYQGAASLQTLPAGAWTASRGEGGIPASATVTKGDALWLRAVPGDTMEGAVLALNLARTGQIVFLDNAVG